LPWPYRRSDALDYTLIGVGVGAIVALGFISPPSEPRLSSSPFDEAARDALRLSSRDARRAADDISDITLSLLTSYALLVDPIVAAAYSHESPSAGVQLALVTIETLAITAALEGLLKMVVGRERPYGRGCGVTISEETDDCADNDRFQSYLSGHTSTSFAAAAVSCTAHAQLGIYGTPGADAVACVSSFAVAGATGLLRIMSDRHFATDVLSGALMGTALGLGLPWLLHYRFDESESAPDVLVVPQGAGAAIRGTF
jgi:membrane-associated phospholipid phosphatase